MAIISACRKYRASEKVFIVLCRLSNTHPFNLRRLFFLKIFLVKSTPGICISIDSNAVVALNSDFIPQL